MKKPTKIFAFFVLFVAISFLGASGARFPLTLIDSDNYKVTIPKEPQRIVIAGGLWPMPSVVAMLSGNADTIVYMPSAAKSAIMNSFLLVFYPRLANIPSGNSENIEELLSYKPDVFICHSANKAICSLMRKSGVPTLAVSVSIWGYDSAKTLSGWLTVIAPLLDKEQIANKILQEVKKQESANKAKQSKTQVKNGDKVLPKAIFIHTYANDEKLTIAGIFGKYLLDSSGGIHALDSLRSANASIEEIYRLNPDIIYINNFTPLLPKQILESKRWQGIKAVQNKRVYKLPLASYRPFAPGVDLPVLLAWLEAHNAEFIESKGGKKGAINEDFKVYAKWYYKEIFGLTLSEMQIEKIFTPQSKAGHLQ